MYDQKRVQEIAALPSPVLPVYLNTASHDPSLHPVVPACLRWFSAEGEALSRTPLPRDGKRFKEQAERFERFLSLRRPQEKAIAASWDQTSGRFFRSTSVLRISCGGESHP